MNGICRTCGTSLAEGSHGIITASDDDSVTFSCRFPLVSVLPRVVQYLASDVGTAPADWPSPGDVQRGHLEEFGK